MTFDIVHTDGGRNIAAARTTYAAIIAYSTIAEKVAFLGVSRFLGAGVASFSRAGTLAWSELASPFFSALPNRAISELFVIDSH